MSKEKRNKITDREDLLSVDNRDFNGGTIQLTYIIDEYGWFAQLEESHNFEVEEFKALCTVEDFINGLSEKNARYFYDLLRKRLG